MCGVSLHSLHPYFSELFLLFVSEVVQGSHYPFRNGGGGGWTYGYRGGVNICILNGEGGGK